MQSMNKVYFCNSINNNCNVVHVAGKWMKSQWFPLYKYIQYWGKFRNINDQICNQKISLLKNHFEICYSTLETGIDCNHNNEMHNTLHVYSILLEMWRNCNMTNEINISLLHVSEQHTNPSFEHFSTSVSYVS